MSKVVPKEERLSKEEIAELPKATRGNELVSVRLSGVGKTREGDLIRTKRFEFLTRDVADYSDIEFTPEEAKIVIRHLGALKTGSVAALPLICRGPQCPWAERCPLQQMGKAPLARPCLLEVELLRDWRMQYLDEYQVDPDSFTEVSIINELAEIEVLNWRINNKMSLAENADLTQDNAIGLDPEGNPIVQRQVSSYMEAKDKLMNRKAKLITMMVGDRKERYKREAALKIRDTRDPSQSMAAIRQKLEQLQRDIGHQEIELQKKAGVIIEAEGSVSKKEKALTPEDLLGGDD